MSVDCDYCGAAAKLVAGNVVYPHRPDLKERRFWMCPNRSKCDAYVGCHPGTERPLGRLANAELRKWKQAAHAAFDPIWQARLDRKRALDPAYNLGMARGGRYRALSEALGIPRTECHIGKFTVELCQRTVEVCKQGLIEA